VNEKTRTAQIQNQQNWRQHRADGSDSYCSARDIRMMKQRRAQRD